MNRLSILLTLAVCMATAPLAQARMSPVERHSHTTHPGARTAAGVKRDSHGRIKRSRQARYAFQHRHPCPSTGKASGPCLGYVVDHIKPLKRGGPDSPDNMQWQTREAARQKDKWE